MAKEKVIFFGNGALAEAALAVLEAATEVIFRARTKEDLGEVKRLKREFPEAHGVLASYGVMIREDVLELFEPEGILNVHPSLLPRFRGASPIESAILAGESDFGVSVMKLVKAMDAGPIYWQETIPEVSLANLGLVSEEGRLISANSEVKAEIYRGLARAGAQWIVENLGDLPEPQAQNEAEATFTEKMSKKMGLIEPDRESATEILRKIVAFAGFPKVKYAFFGTQCTILAAHLAEQGGTAGEAKDRQGETLVTSNRGEGQGKALSVEDEDKKRNVQGKNLVIPCADGQVLVIDRLQPEGRKAMDAKSFLNGYAK